MTWIITITEMDLIKKFEEGYFDEPSDDPIFYRNCYSFGF